MWEVSEAAAYRVASTTAFLREIAKDGRALRGAIRLIGAARRCGGEVTFAGVKFSALSTLGKGSESVHMPGQNPQVCTSANERRGGSAAQHEAQPQRCSGRRQPADAAVGSADSSDAHVLPRAAPGQVSWGPISKAPKAKRFGIKKATQKMRAAARVGAGLHRWLAKARASLSLTEDLARSQALAAAEAAASRISTRISYGDSAVMADACMTDETPAPSARKRAISPSAPMPCRGATGEG